MKPDIRCYVLGTIADVETKYAANSIHYYGVQEREHYGGIRLAE